MTPGRDFTKSKIMEELPNLLKEMEEFGNEAFILGIGEECQCPLWATLKEAFECPLKIGMITIAPKTVMDTIFEFFEINEDAKRNFRESSGVMAVVLWQQEDLPRFDIGELARTLH